MSFQLSIYDFFAYTIPGGLYVLLITYLLDSFTGKRFTFPPIESISFFQTLIFVAVAYLAGLVIDRIAVFWYRIFEPNQLADVVLDRFKKDHPYLEFKFQGKHWPILLAYLQREKPESTAEIHRFNALHIMLKNASFGFIVLSAAELILCFYHGFVWEHLLVGIAMTVASIISARQAVRFKRWFFSANFEAVIARSIDQNHLLTRREQFVGLDKDAAVSEDLSKK